MLEIVRGRNNNPVVTEIIANYLKEINVEGVFYIGYPIIPTLNSSIFIDASLVSPKYGLVLFDLISAEQYENREDIQDEIFNSVESKLKLNKKLVAKRKLIPNINVVTFGPNVRDIDNNNDSFLKDRYDLEEYLKDIEDEENEKIYKELLSAIQAVTNIKTYSTRDNITKKDSRGAKIKNIEENIANLDMYQNQAVIETVEGPQRIRGLAGSGKTIVLALKAAYLHSMNREWDIVVTFNTRSLKSQITELIERFTYEFIKDKPNWNKIRVIHAWGSPNFDGVYYQLCKSHNIEYLDLNQAKLKTKSGYGSEFDYVCNNAINQINVFNQLYDAILIDEAQDFSDSFLKICYSILKEPKRIIWAYDELQTLNKTSMKSPEEIFGYDKTGKPYVQLNNIIGQPKQDIILRKCYRNSKPILTVAHALGFGIYRNEGLVQMFDDKDLWEQIGYNVTDGLPEAGHEVQLERSNESSPRFLQEHSKVEDLIITKVFKNSIEQAEWIAEQIEKNLIEDELEYKDILVIHTNPLTTRKESGLLRNILYNKGINAHLAGVTSSPDEFFSNDSITVTSIYRAKGNEASMIYIMNCEECYSGLELIKKRNILFTAMTRSKGWVRLCGIGDSMNNLIKEANTVIDSKFKLKFKYPTSKEMENLNVIHRDRSAAELRDIEKKNNNLKDIAESLKNGHINTSDLDKESLKFLEQLFRKNE